ncbi:MAG: hypothetical protein MJA30_04395 [Cytophagales bacterium]|nr:hypothetical protein [Cytophagales bacterium]
MDKSQSIQIDCHVMDRVYQMLSIYNLHLNDFLYLFRNCKIEHFSLYWLDGDKDFITSSTCPLPVFDINFLLRGVDVIISSVELELDNSFMIDSNIMDEIFCKVPIDLYSQSLIKKITRAGVTGKRTRYPLSQVSLLDLDTWNTKEIRH